MSALPRMLPRFHCESDSEMVLLSRRCATLEVLLDEERKRNARLYEDIAAAASVIFERDDRIAWLEARLAGYARGGRPC